MKKKIVVLPSDSLEAYIRVGYTWEKLQEYYNPQGYYDEVFILSPFEKGVEIKNGMTIIGTNSRNIRKHIKQIRPDIVRAYDGFKCADWACANKVKDIPVVCSVHDTNPELIHDSLRYADKIICMSEAVKKAILNKIKVIDINRIVIMPNRVDIKKFKPINNSKFRELKNLEYPQKYHILHVGRKVKQKNIETVIRSMTYLTEDYCTIFIGRGDTKEYRKLAEECGVKERCYFLESVQNDDLPLWFSWSDCMCTPSRWEGFGIVFIEAAACGSIIVTSDIEPMNEFLINNENAYLVKNYEDAEKIAETIKIACEKNEKNLIISENAQKVGLNFSREKVDEMEIKLMKEAKSTNQFNIEIIRIKIAIQYICRKIEKKIKRKTK